jgi:hypothetical protein
MRLLSVLTLFLVAACYGQEPNVNAKILGPLITHFLVKYRVSASLSYAGVCDLKHPQPDITNTRATLRNWNSGPVDALREIFADDPKMHVSQDHDGTIRMIERNVPKDLLEVKISRVSFDDSRNRAEALEAILHSAEIQAFVKSHGIDLVGSPIVSKRKPVIQPHVSGDLDNVPLSQALDYVLQTYPGFWVYENCEDAKGKRTVWLQFF